LRIFFSSSFLKNKFRTSFSANICNESAAFKHHQISQKTYSCEVQNQTSKFHGVCWHKDNKKWQAELRYNKKNYYGGLFDNEEQAAMKVNVLCDKCGIERKNPKININPNAIQQVIYSLSTVHRKAK
jgi:hypothetical protein